METRYQDAQDKQLDVAIVGAGVGGCYIAYRLILYARTARVGHPRIALFEGSARIGGRLWSRRAPQFPGALLELGGMRFNSAERRVSSLVRHLGLAGEIRPFCSWRPENIVYARGVRLRSVDLRAARPTPELPFELDPAERGRDASDLEEAAIETALPGFRRLRGQYHRACHADDWGQARAIGARYAELRSQPSLGGGLLQDLSWPEFLDRKLSEEAVKFIRATDGYDNYDTNGNAAESADRLFRVPPDGEFMTLAGGMQSLPTTLHEMFSAAGGATFLRHRLHHIEQSSAASGEPAFRLAFYSREGSGEGGERPVTVYARRVVLAMPPQAAWQIHCNRPVLGEAVGNGIGTVKGVPALKIFLAYPNPWWEQAGVTVGRSTTDLPLRQAWYLPGRQAGAAIMAAYPAGAAVRYWDRYLPGQHVGVLPLGPSERGRAVGPAAAMAASAHRMLGEMHGVAEAPEPTAVAWQDWGEAAWHARRPGHSPQDAGSLLKPPGPLHLVSDCWTSSPGSVDGTLRAAELVLRQHLGCGVPEWHTGEEDWE